MVGVIAVIGRRRFKEMPLRTAVAPGEPGLVAGANSQFGVTLNRSPSALEFGHFRELFGGHTLQLVRRAELGSSRRVGEQSEGCAYKGGMQSPGID